MSHDRHVITSVLKLTDAGPVSIDLLRKCTRFDLEDLQKTLSKLSDSGLVCLRPNLVETSSSQRVNLALKAITLGGDLEETCRSLKWSEFENVAAEALQVNGFKTLRNFRFKHKGKRWELDVIGFKEPIILCIDCKHWRRRLNQSGLIRAVETQVERTEAFCEALPNYWTKTDLDEWMAASIVPLVLSLISGCLKFHNDVPVVSILQFQDFLNTLPFEANRFTHFRQLSLKSEQKLSDYCK